MSTPREELNELVDSLSDSEVVVLLPEVKMLILRREARAGRGRATRDWPPAWFGTGIGSSPDVAARSAEILRAEFPQNT